MSEPTEDDRPREPKRTAYTEIGTLIAVGAGVGAALGVLLGNIAMGVAFGAGGGVVADAILESRHR